MSVIRVFLALIVVVMMAGCKIRLVVPEGGRVTAESGAHVCPSGATCTINITDIYFSEVFRAIPATGYVFSGWKKRDSGFCGNKKTPCELSTTGFGPHEKLMSILESDQTFYLEPVFQPTSSSSGGSSSCPEYVGDFCAGVDYPTCSVPRHVSAQLRDGMTYQEVVELLGCHGHLTSFSADQATYYWGTDTLVPGRYDLGLLDPDVAITFWTAFSPTPEIVVFVVF